MLEEFGETDGIIVAADMQGIGVLRALKEKGKKVPEAAGCGAGCASCGNAAACGGHTIAMKTVAGKDE